MDFAFSEDQELLRASTRRFLDEGRALARLRERLEAPETFDAGDWRDGAALGWTAMLVPPELDGGSVTDQPLVDLVVLAEELGRALHPGPLVPTNVVADAVGRAGTDEQRARFLPPLARGELVAAWCLTADGSADLASVGVRATADGDAYRLDGTAGHVLGATAAGLLLVAAASDDRGLLHLLVPLPAEGVAVRPGRGLDLTRRYAEVAFAATPVPAGLVLEGADPVAVAERALAVATVLQAAEDVGAAGYLFERTVQYAKDRVQFGRPIGSFQAVKHRLADQLVAVEAMRAAAHYAALALGDGLPDAAEAVAVAGAYVPDAFAALCGEALQVHGGIGFTWEHDVHLFLRRAKVDQVTYGDGAWHQDRLCALAAAAAAAS